jgi:CRISPR-associated protein Cmr3
MKEFKYAVVIKPLGLLYGSAGAFLSPDNLVGRSGNHFPPNTATLSGLYVSPRATSQTTEQEKENLDFLNSLMFAGPFWAMTDDPLNFHVPLPLTCETTKPEPTSTGDRFTIQPLKITQIWDWQPASEDEARGRWYRPDELKKKRDENKTWIAIEDWHKLQDWNQEWASILTKNENSPSAAKKLADLFNIPVRSEPWQPAPHLHPRLELDQRRVVHNPDRGSLFLENAVQMHPDACLVYLASHELQQGWYRFGGEGHMVEIESVPLTESLNQLFKQPVGDRFALIAPAAWGSKNFSYRFPVDNSLDPQPIWSIRDMMTERPQPHRFLTKSPKHDPRFSRGRYTVPARTVYVLDEAKPILSPWLGWPTTWFPTDGCSYQRWGSGFALPL